MSLTVRDNGIGLPTHFDWRQQPSLGLTLMRSLAGQIGATWTSKARTAPPSSWSSVQSP